MTMIALDQATSQQLPYVDILAKLLDVGVVAAENATSQPRPGRPIYPSCTPWSSSISPCDPP